VRDEVVPLHRQEWWSSAGRPVRALVASPAGASPVKAEATATLPRLRIVPGLGAMGYVLDLLHACGAWSEAALLDLPGYGNDVTKDCPADLDTLTPVAAGCLGAPGEPPVVLVGHSTGAQLALRAAVWAPSRVAALVLIGITFDPPVRRHKARLVPRLRTYLHERPREVLLTAPDFARGRGRVTQYLRSALADRPEDHVREVTCPVLLLRGQRDTLCPAPWAEQLAALSGGEGQALTLPGAHNVPYTHPGAVALEIGRLAQRL
jgi:pimeloyl-ACP methyl ester carboxylesterase